MRNGRVIVPFVFALALIGSSGLFAGQGTDDPVIDREPFEKLAAEFDDAWNTRNATALAGLFTSEGDIQYWTGKTIAGKENIEATYSSTSFFGMPPDIRHTTTLERARLLKPDVAIGGGFARIAGSTGPDSQPVDMHLLFTCVVINQDGQWRIAALRIMMPQKE